MINTIANTSALMSQVEALLAARRAWGFIPYGAAQTLCPNGSIWQEYNTQGKWHEWTNKPWQWDFFSAGKHARHRLISGGNRVGKSVSPAIELIYHLTGDYPDWWPGFRFDESILAWEWATTNEKSRDVQQKLILGPGGGKNPNLGFLPKDRILDISFRQCGLDNVVDTVQVRFGRGKKVKRSLLRFKVYEAGMKAAQGESVPWIRLDEEIDPANAKHKGIFGECLARLLDCNGFLTASRTPLAGAIEFSKHFLADSEGRWNTTAGYWYDYTDVPHLSAEARKLHIDAIPEVEQPARCRGEEKLGSGRAFMCREEDILCDPFEPPAHFFWILGHDFGLSHPAGFAKLGIDRVNDIWYLVWTYKKAQEQIPYHVATLRSQGDWIPVAWPHDGHRRGYSLKESGGEEIRKLYMQAGANMLPMSARYDNKHGGGQSSEPILQQINNRMRTGRFKVFNTRDTLPFREEFRIYHRDDRGILVDQRDDVIKAVFYAAMMARFAIQKDFRIPGSVYKGSMVA